MDYPATLDVTTPDRIANWRPLLQWLLALPHMIIAFALSYVAPAVAFIAWFAILFTGRLPEGLATFQVMILRYTTRAQLYQGFLFDKYPEFDFSMTSQEPGGSPVTLSVTPSLEGRNRLTVFFRLFTAIPAVIFAVLFTGPVARRVAPVRGEVGAGLRADAGVHDAAHRPVPAVLARLRVVGCR
jgi:hypothetical protein